MKSVAVLFAALVFAGPAVAARLDGPFPGYTGGPYTTASGETVTVYSADALAADPAYNQHWADFLASLPHGLELALVTVYIAPLAQVEVVCGADSLACYDPSTDKIFSTADDVPDQATAQSILAHEYGHHIANNRTNPPWSTEDWGTKRWATYMQVCSGAKAGLLFPGNEGDHYTENPAEIFAEDYRVLVEQTLGLTASPWVVVDRSLYPDATALSLLQEDIAQPWQGPTTAVLRGSFGNGTVRTFGIATPLDGTLTLALHPPAGSAFDLRVYNAAGKLVAHGPRSIQLTVCGTRSYRLQVHRTRGTGTFTVSVSKP